MIKKSLTVIAGSLLAVNVASATELYNKDGSTFSVGGYLKFGYQSAAKDLDGKMENVNGKYNTSRINFGGTREINSDLTAFGKVEWKINAFAESGETLLSNRLAFAGFDHKSYGKVSFGRQWSSYYNVANFTDRYEITGNEAVGVYDDNESGGFIGTGRANSALQYNKAFGDTKLSLQYQANQKNDETNLNNPNTERKYSFGTSLVQSLGDNFKVGIAGNYAKLNSKFTSVKIDRASAVAGISYDSDMFVAAATVSYNTNMHSAGVYESTSIGQESFVGIKIGQPALVYVGNNYSTTTYDDNQMNMVSISKDNTTDFNYVAIGTKYSLNQDVVISAEYRQELRSKKEIEEASTSENSMNNLVVAVKYSF